MKKIYKRVLSFGLTLFFSTALTTMSFGQFGCGSGVVVADGYTQFGITTPGTGGVEDWNVNPTGTSINGLYWDDDVYLFEYTSGATYEEISMSIFTRNSWNGVGIFDDCNVDVFSNEIDASSTTTASFTHTVGALLSPGQTVYVAVGQWGAPNALDFDVTDFSVTQIACPYPSNLALDAVGGTDATISWTENGSATEWNIEWGATGFAPGTGAEDGAIAATTNNPETITGLTAETDYDIYVQSDCGGDQSAWIGPLSITTMCNSVVAPWTEGFENAGAIPDCWTQGLSNAKDWEFANTGGTDHIGSDGTINGTTSTNNYFAWLDDSGPHELGTALLSPMIDVSALTVPMLEFYRLSDNEGNTNVDFSVDVWDGAAWNIAVYSSNSNSANQAWEYIQVNLMGLTITDDIQIRFVVDENNGTDFYDDVAIDDVGVIEAPTCPQPSVLNISNVTPTTADVDWTLGGTETEWIIEYDTTGFILGTGQEMVTTNNPETLTGLMANTNYDVYVRALCSLGDTSNFVGPVPFTTECSVFEALSFCESFDSDSPTQNCWTVLDENADGDVWNMDYGVNPNTGDESAMLRTDFNSGDNDDWLISPQISLNSNEIMNFFYRVQSSNEPNDFEVLLSTTGKNPADFEDTLMYLASYDNTSYLDTTVDLSAFSGDVYIAFHVPSGGLDGWRLYIDDVCFDVCIPAPGQDGSADVCRADGLTDLNSLIVKGQENGEWVYPGNQQLIVDDSLFNVVSLPAGEYDVLYIVEGGCTNDTTVATVTVFPPSSAGQDGTLNVCKNEPINLFDGLSGNVDLGGTWYDPSNTAIAGSQPTASNFGGSYNYDYITSNGVCQADTSLVEVIVDGNCDWLSIGEEKMNKISVFPNPATNVINIANPSNSESLKVEILDMNGRIVLTDAKALANATEGAIDVSHLVKGMYTLRVYNEDSQKTFKVVIQ